MIRGPWSQTLLKVLQPGQIGQQDMEKVWNFSTFDNKPKYFEVIADWDFSHVFEADFIYTINIVTLEILININILAIQFIKELSTNVILKVLNYKKKWK